MEIGTLCRLSNNNIYVNINYRGLTVIVLDKHENEKINIPGTSGIPQRSSFFCFVVEKSEKLWVFDYQMKDAEVLS